MVINMSQEGNLGQGMKRLYNTARGHVMLKTHKEHIGPEEKDVFANTDVWNY
jgi:hypothetical protein